MDAFLPRLFCILLWLVVVKEKPYERKCSLQVLLLIRCHAFPRSQSCCGLHVSGRQLVFHFLKYVTWFLEFVYWHILNFANAPGPFGERGEMAMAIARLPCAPLRSTSDGVSSPLYSFTVPGAAGHNRGAAAERQPLAGTQGRNLDRGLNFKPTPCVWCLLTPRERPQVRRAPSPEPDCQDGRHSFSAGRSRSARQDARAAIRVPSMPTGHSCTIAHGASSASWGVRRAPRVGLCCVLRVSYSIVWWAPLLSFVPPGSCLRASACLATTTFSTITTSAVLGERIAFRRSDAERQVAFPSRTLDRRRHSRR